MLFEPVRDAGVRQAVRLLFAASGLLFLATIVLGIANAFSPQPLDRGQVLSHFHSGTIGWVTLSVIASSLWLYVGGRDVGQTFRAWCLGVAGVGAIAVAGYVAAFGLYFSGNGPAWMLPAFGIPSGLAIIAAMVLVAGQARQVATLTTAHMLMLGALIVASLGAIMGILVGLSHNGAFTFPAAGDAIGAHAGPMDMYLALAFAGIVEALVVKEARHWSKPGMTQMLLGVGGGFVASLGLFFGIEPAPPIALLSFLVAFGFFAGRIGWSVIRSGPTRDPALWWGTLSFPAYVFLFVALVFVYFIPGELPPHALGVTFMHVTFVGMATNLVFAAQAAYLGGVTDWGKRSIWILNVGMLLFFAGEFAAGSPHGALIMAIGILMAWAHVCWPIIRSLRP